MTTVYKSKDIDYMRTLKKAVLKGMRGKLPEEKEYTWEYIRKQVTMDDMHSYAISQLGKLVKFPTENFNAPLMSIFLDPPTPRELDILEKMTTAAGLAKEDVYTTYLHKAEPDNPQELQTLDTILNSEISIVAPKLILSFGIKFGPEAHKVLDFKNAKIMTTYDMDYLNEDNEIPLDQRKRALWLDVQELIRHYKSN